MTTLLELDDLTMHFGGVVALNGLRLNVGEGEILGLIGPNGSGKTTCFNVVTGIYRASKGRIVFDGQDVSRHAPQRIYRAGIARTFQRSRLCLTLSIFDNIMIGNHARLNHGLVFNVLRRRAFLREVDECIEKARSLAGSFSATLADGMFEPVAGFPMIDRRRIEICRALISEPRLLLLDEPSAGMTQEETRELMDDILAVRERLSGLSIIIVEHDMDVIVRVTDRCAVLNYGRLIGQGTYREITADPAVRSAYLGEE